MTSRALACAALVAALAGCIDDGVPAECGEGRRSYDALSYALSGRFDWDAGVLHATEELELALCPGFEGVLELDAAVQVTHVRSRGRELTFRVEDPAPGPGEVEPLATSGGGLLTVFLPGPHPGTVQLEVEYTVRAGDHSSLTRLRTAEDGGPLQPLGARLVSTDSEPLGGHHWLVQKDEVRDRARFSIALDLGPGEDLVANGARVLDVPLAGGRRRVGYAIDVPIPTYVMAFAAGELTSVERRFTSASGRSLPLVVWHRRGLALEPGAVLDHLARSVERLEALVGPYPFDTCALLVRPAPPFGLGMENVTLTTVSEDSVTGALHPWLLEHELAHQWFGDWVTIRTPDDLWVKEGVATLLHEELARADRDREGRGRLMGTDLGFYPFDAIVDRDLPADRKYTSGPYFRGAWLLTQLRVLVGEEPFWRSLRTFLATHARGSATSEDLVRAFSPELDEATIRRVLGLLELKGAQVALFSSTPVAGGTSVTLHVIDGGQLLVPLEVAVVGPDGAAELHVVEPDPSLTVLVPEGGYLAPDERDVHPFGAVAELPAALVLPPARGPAMAAFLSRSAAHQERALARGLPALEPGELVQFAAGLDSPSAWWSALRWACAAHGAEPAWTAALTEALRTPPRPAFSRNLFACGPEVGRAWLSELLALEADPRPDQLTRLEYLISFAYPEEGLAAIARLAAGAPTLELRAYATTRLALDGP